jgi:negative regulator of sigma E activity
MSENTQITEQEADVIALDLIRLHSFDVVVDAENFLDLLKNSLSLSVVEKKRVIDAVPTLSQFQFDELTKVFQEERVKFRELAGEHPEDIKKLLKKQQEEWIELGEIYKIELAKKEVQSEDEQKIDDIKKSLGL